MRSASIAFSAVAVIVLPCAIQAREHPPVLSGGAPAVRRRRTHITRVSARPLSLTIRGGGSSLEGPSKPQRMKKKAKAGKSGRKPATGAGEGLTQRKESNDAENNAAAVPSPEEHSNLAKLSPRKSGLSDSEQKFESALLSLGLALGSGGTDYIETSTAMDADADGEIETIAYYQCSHCSSTRPSSNSKPVTLLADYIVKTNGGTHIVQTLLSLVAVSMGVACLLLPPFPRIQNNKSTTAESLSLSMLRSSTKYKLMQQTLLLAAVRYLVAMLGAINLSASQIRQLGIRNARRHLEQVALHPVGQCLFSCSLLVAWLKSSAMGDYAASMRGSVVSVMNSSGEGGVSTTTTRSLLLDLLSQQPPPWFSSREYGGAVIALLILGPLLLRETISIIWTFSDLISISVSGDGPLSRLASSLTSATRSILDIFMFILFKSEDWRNADSFHRQKSLARLVARWSQLIEWAVGALLTGDAVHSFWTLAFVPSSSTGSNMTFKRVLGKAVCANMYVSFLLSRRRRSTSSTPMDA